MHPLHHCNSLFISICIHVIHDSTSDHMHQYVVVAYCIWVHNGNHEFGHPLCEDVHFLDVDSDDAKV